ncbi:MAG: DUF5668 domain-containing protein [Bacteroidota bacterium]
MHDFEHIHEKHKSDNKNIVGFIFIIIGAILLVRNFHFIPHWISNVFISWQMLLIAIGFVAIFIKKNLISGLILISIGGIFLMNKFWFFTPVQWQLVWPAVFIFVGILLIGNVIGDHQKQNRYNNHQNFELDDLEVDDDFYISDNYKSDNAKQ